VIITTMDVRIVEWAMDRMREESPVRIGDDRFHVVSVTTLAEAFFPRGRWEIELRKIKDEQPTQATHPAA
jgi:hypothetical protein